MIRFCDRETYFIKYENLDKKKLLDYFLNNHVDESVYVIDANGTYKGRILYHALLHSADIKDALLEGCVVLDEQIWQNTRAYFSDYTGENGPYELLPVVDCQKKLICFAYEDVDANREIRMLRELEETEGTLQFSDIYPQCKSVKIYGFNELAYFFAKYLEKLGIGVRVEGSMWKKFFTSAECQTVSYESLTIYAEGVGPQKNTWMENFLTSVSVEFECIDHIYETNIKQGFIRDANGSYAEFIENLRDKEVIIVGTGTKSQEAYDFLLEQGIHTSCFIGESNDKCNHSMFGKRIQSSLAARKIYRNAVFLDCTSRHSTLGLSGVNKYDYMGYKRNERYFVIRDYIEIPENGIKNAMKQWKIVLAGDVYLCRRLYSYLAQNEISVLGYLNISSENDEIKNIPEVSAEDIEQDTMCLLVVPEYFNPDSREKRKKMMEMLLEYVKNSQIDNYTDYFSYTNAFIHIEKSNFPKYTEEWLQPKKVVLGAAEGHCGNILFRESLDNHPSIFMFSEYNYLNNDLMWICIRLSTEDAENIRSMFWKLYGNEREQSIYDPDAFNEKLDQLLSQFRQVTSQELFVMLHMAYMYMLGQDVLDMRDTIIYWEPHTVTRKLVENSVNWLGCSGSVSCDIINIVRNICIRNGSVIKENIREQWGGPYSFYRLALSHPDIEKKEYDQSSRLILKFEDLKKNPKKILSEICDRWDIDWADTLMMTSCQGKQSSYDNGERLVRDFDLDVIYNTYDKYSELDRLRLSIINAPWQRKYGYPYVSVKQFSRRELQEMFLKEFHFEELEEFHKEKTDLFFRIQVQIMIRQRLTEVWMAEVYPE